MQRGPNRINSACALDSIFLEAHSDVGGPDSDTLPVTLEASKISGPGSIRNTPSDLGQSPLEEPSTDSSMCHFLENVDVKLFSHCLHYSGFGSTISLGIVVGLFFSLVCLMC